MALTVDGVIVKPISLDGHEVEKIALDGNIMHQKVPQKFYQWKKYKATKRYFVESTITKSEIDKDKNKSYAIYIGELPEGSPYRIASFGKSYSFNENDGTFTLVDHYTDYDINDGNLENFPYDTYYFLALFIDGSNRFTTDDGLTIHQNNNNVEEIVKNPFGVVELKGMGVNDSGDFYLDFEDYFSKGDYVFHYITHDEYVDIKERPYDRDESDIGTIVKSVNITDYPEKGFKEINGEPFYFERLTEMEDGFIYE